MRSLPPAAAGRLPFGGVLVAAHLLLAGLIFAVGAGAPAVACDVEAVAAGERHAAALRADGSVWVWGEQRRRGTFRAPPDPTRPSLAEGLQEVVALAARGGTTLVARADGSVWGWGDNRHGQLGSAGGRTEVFLPVQVQGIDTAVEVALGGTFALARLADGTVLAWGSNDRGQLGDGTFDDSLDPVPVQGLADVTALAAGHAHALALLADDTVRAWGDNGASQLGDGTVTDRSLPVTPAGLPPIAALAAGPWQSFAVAATGEVLAWGWNDTGILAAVPVGATASVPTPVTGAAGIVAVAAGESHALALRDDGTLLAWGNNASGALGVEAPSVSNDALAVAEPAGVQALAAGGAVSLALLADGTVRAWGANDTGQLGVAAQVEVRQPAEVAGLAGVEAIHGGGGVAFARTTDPGLLGWGMNLDGAVGVGSAAEGILLPTALPSLPAVSTAAAASDHAHALGTGGSVWSWGSNDRGQLGDSALAPTNEPVQVPGLPSNLRAIAAGAGFSVAVRASGGLLAWGDNRSGQLGLGGVSSSEPPTPLTSPTNVRALSAGRGHVLALTTSGEVWSWGLNDRGQLGDGTTADRAAPSAVAGLPAVDLVAAGRRFSLAWGRDGRLWSWGANASGQLARGPDLRQAEPTPAGVDGLPTLTDLAAGGDFALGLTQDGTVLVWGAGRLEAEASAPETPRPVPLPRPAVDLLAGEDQACALLDDGTVWCWGRNDFGELGIGTAAWSTTPRDPGFGGPVPELGSTLRLTREAQTINATWARVYNALSYNLHRAGDAPFQADELVGGTDTTSLPDPAPPAGLVFYQVRGVSCAGVEGP